LQNFLHFVHPSVSRMHPNTPKLTYPTISMFAYRFLLIDTTN
jgi:hypothetical protein